MAGRSRRPVRPVLAGLGPVISDERDIAAKATGPALWLLDRAGAAGGVALTQTHALSRGLVREAAERWPGWWDAELFGPPHREADVRVLGELHAGLRRLRLVRRRGRRLHTTQRGLALAEQPGELLRVVAGDLGAGDPFAGAVAFEVVAELREHPHASHEQLTARALLRVHREGWAGPNGERPDEHGVSWTVSDVLSRGEAYGLVERHPDPSAHSLRSRGVALSSAGHLVFGAGPRDSRIMTVLIFDAQMLNVPGVSARVAVGAEQHLTALHDAIQEAFGWEDDHLYSFWLDNAFWGDRDSEITSPVVPDEAPRTADLPIAELDLQPGRQIAYVFDFGDEWRVRLTLQAVEPGDDGRYPRVLERTGQAPPQYASLDDED